MCLVGVGFIAIAVITSIIVKPRDGVLKLVGKPFLEAVVALIITITGAVAMMVTFIGSL